jgi:hypothetical protein
MDYRVLSELEEVTKKLIEGLIIADINYRKALIKSKRVGIDLVELFGTVNPAFELAEALGVHFDFIKDIIVSGVNMEKTGMTPEDCAEVIFEQFVEMRKEWWDDLDSNFSE